MKSEQIFKPDSICIHASSNHKHITKMHGVPRQTISIKVTRHEKRTIM